MKHFTIEEEANFDHCPENSALNNDDQHLRTNMEHIILKV